MTIGVIGDSVAALKTLGFLRMAQFHTVLTEGDYTIEIEDWQRPEVLLDSIDCPLEKSIFTHIRQLTTSPVLIQTAGGVQSDRRMRIRCHPKDAETVSKGILRGFLNLTTVSKEPWYRRLFR